MAFNSQTVFIREARSSNECDYFAEKYFWIAITLFTYGSDLVQKIVRFVIMISIFTGLLPACRPALAALPVESFYETALSLESSKRFDDIVRVCSQILEKKPGDKWASIFAGRACFRKRDFTAAEKYYNTAYDLKYLSGSVESLIEYGRILGYNSKPEKALAVLDEALAISPGHYDGLVAAGQTCLWSKKYGRAGEYFTKASTKAPEGVDARLGLARSLYFQRKYGESEAIFDEMMKKRPGDPDVVLAFAQLQTWKGRHREAAGLYEAVLGVRPDDREARTGLARSLIRAREFARAEALISKIVSGGKASADERKLEAELVSAMCSRAMELSSDGEHGAAKKSAERILARRPFSPEGLRTMVAVAAAAKNPGLARSHVEYAAKKRPADATIANIEAAFLEGAGEYARAAGAYRRLLSMKLGRGQAFEAGLGLARSLACSGDRSGSQGVLFDLACEEPGNVEVRTLRAKNYLAAGMTDEAEAEAVTAVFLAPGDAAALAVSKAVDGARIRSARSLADARKFNQAILTLERLRAKDPGNLEVVQNIGYARGCMGDTAECFACYERVLAASPDNYEAMLQYARFRLAGRDAGRAYELNSYVAAKEPGNVDALMGQADCLAATREHDKAIEIYRKVLAIRPDFLQPALDIALNLSWMKKYDEAVSGYSRILKRKPDCLEAMIGLARTFAWAGRINESLRRYRAALSMPGAGENRDLLLGYGNVLHWAGLDEEAMDKVRKLKSLGGKIAGADELRDGILRSHKNAAWITASGSSDSDGAKLSSRGFGAEADIDLNTRITATRRHYDARISGGNNAEWAKVTGLKAVRVLNDRVRVSGGLNVFELPDAAKNPRSTAAPYFGVTWREFNRTVISFLADRSVLIDTPTLIRNGVSSLSRTLDFQRYFNRKNYVSGGFSISDYSDDNRRRMADLEADFLLRESELHKIYLGPVAKRYSFDRKSAMGYYSPSSYNVSGLFYRLELKNRKKDLSLVIREEFGRQKTEERPAVAYHSLGVSLYRALGEEYSLEAGYKTGNSAGVSDTAAGSGYDYRSWTFRLNRRW